MTDLRSSAERGTSTERGYGAEHRRLRKQIQKQMDAGKVFTCWRCGRPIVGDWDLGHDDNDRSKHMGPEHSSCNRATSSHQAGNVVDESRLW